VGGDGTRAAPAAAPRRGTVREPRRHAAPRRGAGRGPRRHDEAPAEDRDATTRRRPDRDLRRAPYEEGARRAVRRRRAPPC